jgi:hypothetical protein
MGAQSYLRKLHHKIFGNDNSFFFAWEALKLRKTCFLSFHLFFSIIFAYTFSLFYAFTLVIALLPYLILLFNFIFLFMFFVLII